MIIYGTKIPGIFQNLGFTKDFTFKRSFYKTSMLFLHDLQSIWFNLESFSTCSFCLWFEIRYDMTLSCFICCLASTQKLRWSPSSRSHLSSAMHFSKSGKNIYIRQIWNIWVLSWTPSISVSSNVEVCGGTQGSAAIECRFKSVSVEPEKLKFLVFTQLRCGIQQQ